VVAESSFVSLAGGAAATWRLGRDILLLGGGPPPDQIAGPAVFVTGTPAPGAAMDSTAIAGKVVFLLIERGPTPLARQVARLHAAAIVGISPIPDSIWTVIAGRRSDVVTRNPSQGPFGPPACGTREATARAVLAGAGIDLDSARAAMAGPVTVRALPGVSVRIAVRQRVLDRASAPNVIGILEGSDPRLKRQYLFLTGHMGHIGTPGAGEGCSARGGDSICNGADDDASGTTAVIEAADAFSRLMPRPKRSLVFMTVSGEERGLWGSQYFSEHPTVPLGDVVADLNIDMVGRNWKDTIVAIGKEHSDLGATLNRVGAAHPELHMTPIDDIWPQENFYFRSDHFNFARKGVPILFFFNGTHPDYHQVGDSPDKIDAEKESRIIKLVFYLGLDEQLFPSGPARHDVHRRVDPPIGEGAHQSQLRVARPLELFEYHVVHAALRLDERRGDHAERPARRHGARRAEERFGLGEGVGVEPSRHRPAARAPCRVVRAREPRERVEHDHGVLAELDLASCVLEHHVGHRDVPLMRQVEARCDHLAAAPVDHLAHLFGPLVDEQDEEDR